MTQQELDIELNSFPINSVTNEQLIRECEEASVKSALLGHTVDNIRNRTLNDCHNIITEEAIEALDKLSEVVDTTRVAYAHHHFKLKDALCNRLSKAINTQPEN